MASWGIMGLILHDLTFRTGWADLAVSQKELKVDDGGSNSTFESLFGKLRIMQRSLPDWLRPELEFKYCKVTCPRTGSILWGESTTTDSGRGGTVHRAYMDEVAFIPKAEQVWASIRPMALSGILVSNPNGRHNLHGRIRFDKNSSFRKVSIHWTQRPDRTQAWYDREIVDLLPHLVASEFELSYSSSQPGRVLWNFDETVHVPAGGVPYDPKDGPVYRGWDLGVAASTAIVWAQRRTVSMLGRFWPQIRVFRSYNNSDASAQHYAGICQGVQDELHHARPVDFGDPSGWNRDSSLSSWGLNLRNEGIDLLQAAVHDNGQIVNAEDRVDRTRWFMQTRELPLILFDREGCDDLLDAVELWSYPTNPDGTRKQGSKPLKDWASHLGDALGYITWELFSGYDPNARPQIYVPQATPIDREPVTRSVRDEEW